jgi:hypothetical protein
MTRDYMFRTVSQIMVNYRDSPLSRGAAGQVRGGDRLPWVAVDSGDNYAPLKEICWQAHVYGTVEPSLSAWCVAHGVKLHTFAWRAEHQAAGLVRNALYLMRPDSYVALADEDAAPDGLDSYFATRRITPSSTP